MDKAKAGDKVVGNMKAGIRAACTSLRRHRNIVARTRFKGTIEEAQKAIQKEVGKKSNGGVFYTLKDNEGLRDSGIVMLHIVKGTQNADEVAKEVAATCRKFHLDVRKVNGGLRITGLNAASQNAAAKAKKVRAAAKLKAAKTATKAKGKKTRTKAKVSA